jgi:hypothetical protein
MFYSYWVLLFIGLYGLRYGFKFWGFNVVFLALDKNVVVLAATQRMDLLDVRLMYYGRLYRQVWISSPDINGNQKRINEVGKQQSTSVC